MPTQQQQDFALAQERQAEEARFDQARRDQARLDARALEVSASVDRVLQLHLIECRDRYMAVQAALVDINKMMFRGMAALVMLLISIMGYLFVHGWTPLH